MTRRKTRDSKAQSTHVAAMRIVEAESTQRRLKTARLRELRLARQAKSDDVGEQAQAK